MIFADEPESPCPGNADLPRHISARDLLAACAAELNRQAAALADLDAALGAVLLSAPCAAKGRAPVRGQDMAALQQTDRIRQEMEGLARALALVLKAGSLSDALGGDEIAACTPVAALRDRLLRLS